ncbi:outer membrane protein [Rhizobium sp. LC145]|uniref:outer membrane protein n=1 Tax=Rhizobium sp. LC145 TaxID=1120688 RepID=UPI00062A2ABC|nr:outer membrane protein [Rhizobium sp. LC145]KKX30384.1 HEAT resistant agglutinin 1 protein [Rhizobium sp. LC145]TKT56735.1 porin family protein [Rhizobiaceae bacterium LC148]
MKKSLIGAALLALAGSAAYSADLYEPQPEPIIDAPEVEIQEASGWYLRGDVGYSFNHMRGAEYFQGSNAFLADFDRTTLKDSFVVGAGVGYQVNNYLRTDLTFDYLGKSDFRGSTTGWCGSVMCSSRDEAEMRAYSLMANVYVDLGTYGRVTPYVGAGIGGSYVKWGKLRNRICDDPSMPGCYGSDHEGKGSWRFSYALMAGATIDLTCNLKADIGYRFRHISGGDMFGYMDNGGPGRDKGFDMHEARVGARYVFNGCETPVAYEPPPEPIVYK